VMRRRGGGVRGRRWWMGRRGRNEGLRCVS
jgi:hypothetical protein